MTRAKPQPDLTHTLECDKVMALHKYLERYGVQRTEVDNYLPVVSWYLSKTNYARTSKRHAFVCHDATYAALVGWQLRHLAGVTQMRVLLEAATEDWRNEANRVKGSHVPDGVWTKGNQSIAVEYDTGSYSTSQLEDKIEVFAQHYDAQVWGSPSPTRLKKLDQQFNALGLGDTARALYCPWD